MDHFEGVAFEAVEEEKHDGIEVRLGPWRALNAKNNIFNLIVLFYGVEHMLALVGGDVDDHFLFDPVAWSWMRSQRANWMGCKPCRRSTSHAHVQRLR
jgi:hypothetical protein